MAYLSRVLPTQITSTNAFRLVDPSSPFLFIVTLVCSSQVDKYSIKALICATWVIKGSCVDRELSFTQPRCSQVIIVLPVGRPIAAYASIEPISDSLTLESPANLAVHEGRRILFSRQ